MKKKLAEWIWEEFARRHVVYNADIAAQNQAKEMISDIVSLLMSNGEHELNKASWSFLCDHSVKHDLAESFQRAVDKRIDTIFKQYQEGIKKNIDEYISSEEFIDKIIDRINKKQLK